ncbi:protein-disulfide isomerase [Chitinophaga caeni]|uniref:Protein-disulfide isomerase n=1 Tax=Chitinophaga caeni TaxID=2029983 RepID=A0A291QVN7_9BACT|nr:DsbA family protein [Chitinophaga caeni]ATL47923.1 protein-disulfide isomerase [Chitinophaga caeni]
MEIIYVYDALCGWCYGFTPVMMEFQKRHPEYEYQVLSGGMMQQTPARKMAAYIQQAYKSVEQATGVKFGPGFLEGILNSPAYIMDSLKPAIALTAFKSMAANEALAFAHEIQVAFNYDGKDLNKDETYLEIASKFNIDAGKFAQLLGDPDTLKASIAEIEQVQQWGITGFPAVIFGTGQQLYLVARGFLPLENLEETIQKILASEREGEG